MALSARLIPSSRPSMLSLRTKAYGMLTMVIFPGDLYQGNTNDWDFQFGSTTWYGANPPGRVPSTYTGVTNYIYQLRAAGISVYACEGNHDSDEPGSQLWWTNMFTPQFVTNDPYFYSFQTNGDTRSTIYKGTVSGFKFAVAEYPWMGASTGLTSVAAVDAAYQPQTAWITNQMASDPNRHWIVVAHFFVDSFGMMSTSDDIDTVLYPYIGPGVTAWNDGLNMMPNLMQLECGHDRQKTPCTITPLMCSLDYHIVPCARFDTQGSATIRNHEVGLWATNGAGFFLHTIDPNTMTLITRTYNADVNQFVTNGQWQINTTAPLSVENQNNSIKWFPR